MGNCGVTPYTHRNLIKQLRQLLQDRYTWDGDGFSILKELIQNANDAGATRLDLGWVPATTKDSVHLLLGSAALFTVNDCEEISWKRGQLDSTMDSSRHWCDGFYLYLGNVG
jgi:hypothetical protein